MDDSEEGGGVWVDFPIIYLKYVPEVVLRRPCPRGGRRPGSRTGSGSGTCRGSCTPHKVKIVFVDFSFISIISNMPFPPKNSNLYNLTLWICVLNIALYYILGRNFRAIKRRSFLLPLGLVVNETICEKCIQ